VVDGGGSSNVSSTRRRRSLGDCYDGDCKAAANFKFCSICLVVVGGGGGMLLTGDDDGDDFRTLYGYGTPAECDNAVLYYELAANEAINEIKKRKVSSSSNSSGSSSSSISSSSSSSSSSGSSPLLTRLPPRLPTAVTDYALLRAVTTVRYNRSPVKEKEAHRYYYYYYYHHHHHHHYYYYYD